MNMTEWIQKQYVVAGIAAVCLVSMLVKCLIRYKYRAMLREVQDMGHSKHKLVKSMVMKLLVIFLATVLILKELQILMKKSFVY